MSAFVVSKNHLDLLVTAGLRLESWYGPIRWFDREPTDGERDELFVAGSAFSLGGVGGRASAHPHDVPGQRR